MNLPCQKVAGFGGVGAPMVRIGVIVTIDIEPRRGNWASRRLLLQQRLPYSLAITRIASKAIGDANHC